MPSSGSELIANHQFQALFYLYLCLQKSISSSKLSASVPEFVPRIAYTGKTPASDVVLVINSNLSPFVPEFRPSVSVTPSGSSHQTIHSLQDQTKQAYVKQEKTELQQVSISPEPSPVNALFIHFSSSDAPVILYQCVYSLYCCL